MEHRSCIFRFADVGVDESNFSDAKAGEPLPLEHFGDCPANAPPPLQR